MPEYQLLRCSVALAGDKDQVVVRGRQDPILFPELIVLQFIHGEDAITDVHVVGHCDMAADEAWQRLTTIYGDDKVRVVFPGARPSVPRADKSVPLCNKPIYQPAPTLPASPDPKLRPLTDIIVPVSAGPTRAAPPQPIEREPTPDEIAAHTQDDEPADISDAELREMGLGEGSLLTAGRTAYPGQTAAASPPVLDAAMGSTDRKRTRVAGR